MSVHHTVLSQRPSLLSQYEIGSTPLRCGGSRKGQSSLRMKGVTACARPSVTTKTTASTIGTRCRRRGDEGSRRARLADGTAVRVGVVMVARSRRSGVGQGGGTRLTLRDTLHGTALIAERGPSQYSPLMTK